MSTSNVTNLLLLGSQSDPLSERGVTCAGEVPDASDPELVSRARVAGQPLVIGRSFLATTISAMK